MIYQRQMKTGLWQVIFRIKMLSRILQIFFTKNKSWFTVLWCDPGPGMTGEYRLDKWDSQVYRWLPQKLWPFLSQSSPFQSQDYTPESKQNNHTEFSFGVHDQVIVKFGIYHRYWTTIGIILNCKSNVYSYLFTKCKNYMYIVDSCIQQDRSH